MRQLYLDIETAPTIGAFYGRYDLSISPQQVIDNGFILCFQYAWGDGAVHVESLKDKGKLTSKSDKQLVKRLAELLGEADVVVAHNADKFDIPVITARMACHGLKPFAMPKVIDTLKVCRRFFKFEANSLDSACRQLGIGIKGKSGGFDTSLACMNGDKKAWNTLLKYGKQDVVLLRSLYYRIRPWMKNHPNNNLYNEAARSCCHVCANEKIEYRGYAYTNTMRYSRYKCLDPKCGAWGQDRGNNLDKEKRATVTRGC